MHKVIGRVRVVALSLVSVALLAACGCHTIEMDPIQPPTGIAQIPIPAQCVILPATADYVFGMHIGIFHQYNFTVGKALKQYSEAYIAAAFPAGKDIAVQVDIVNYQLDTFFWHTNAVATCDIRFAVSRNGKILFDKTYHGQGNPRPDSDTGTVFTMGPIFRHTTDEALRNVFNQFLTDAQAQCVNWR
jgi:hypothetical protein